MRDLQYLNSIYESLEEGVGIKTTKLKPFYDHANGYESQINPNTNHAELNNPARRSVRYDYGKATYDQVTADEMIRDVKADKSRIKNYRIIYDLDDPYSFVEYELRANGTPYAIYGNADRQIEIEGKTYKNIRYTPWQRVARNADLIYRTDEYDHEITPDSEAGQRRQNNARFIQLPKPVDRQSPEFDAHNTYGNIYGKNPENGRYAPVELDTGAHDVKQAFSDYNVRQSFMPYIRAREEVKKFAASIERLSAALRKLEKDYAEDQIMEADYQRRKEKWSSELADNKVAYKAALLTLRKCKDKFERSIDEKSAQLATKLRLNIKEFAEALEKGHRLVSELENLRNTSIRSKYATQYSFKNLYNALKNAIAHLEQAQEELANNQQDSNLDAAGAQENLEQRAAQYDYALREFTNWQDQQFTAYVAEIDRLESEIKAIEAKLAELRPKAAAKKAERAAKNRTVEIDPALVDILDFDGDDESEANSTNTD